MMQQQINNQFTHLNGYLQTLVVFLQRAIFKDTGVEFDQSIHQNSWTFIVKLFTLSTL